MISARVFCRIHSFVSRVALLLVTAGVILSDPLENVILCSLVIVVGVAILVLFLLMIVAAVGDTESMISSVRLFPLFAIDILVPRTPAMSPPPPILTHVDVRTRPQRRPSERIA